MENISRSSNGPSVLLASFVLAILSLSLLAPVWSQSAVAVSMDLSPTEATMSQGVSTRTQLATVTLNLVFYVGPEPLTVTLSSSGQPSGVDIQFDPNPMDISGGTVTSAMTATTAFTTPTGDFTLTVTATLSNGAQDSEQFRLRIVARCIIATAAYGSELSGPVQFLRTFRDQIVLKTFAGSEFMKAFNAWYYSFSPGVASFISESSLLRALTRALIYPLIGILGLASFAYSMFGFNSEVGVVVSGMVAGALIGTIYLSPPLTLVMHQVRRKRTLQARGVYLVSGAILVFEACVMFLAEIGRLEWLMMVMSAGFVLTATVSAGVVVSAILLHIFSRRHSRAIR